MRGIEGDTGVGEKEEGGIQRSGEDRTKWEDGFVCGGKMQEGGSLWPRRRKQRMRGWG